MRWDDVNCRARGLATHLLDVAALRRIAALRTQRELVLVLREASYPLAGDSDIGLEELLHAVSLMTVRRFALLGKWLGPLRSVLAVVYEQEERQTLRSLLRGTVQGLSPAGKLAALMPTPGLASSALQQLAQAQSPGELAALLLRHGHPAGRALQQAIKDPQPAGLLGLELALARTFAARAGRAARRGGRTLRTYAAALVDLENAWTLLQAPQWGQDVRADDLFLSGGKALSQARFAALATRETAAIRDGLREVFAGSPFEAVFSPDTVGEAELERKALAAQIAWCRSMSWLQPLGPVVTLEVLLRIRAEAHDVRAAAWAIALAAPVTRVAAAVAG